MAKSIAVGTKVIYKGTTKADRGYTYMGPALDMVENPNFECVRHNIFAGEVQGKAEHFAPIDEVNINPKDARITAQNVGGAARYKWAATDGELVFYGSTKREVVAEAAIRLAIKDWHAAE